MYPPISPPSGIPPSSMMSRRQAKEYFLWFAAALQNRISILEAAVRDSEGGAGWTSDFSTDSLLSLGRWLAANAKARPLPAGEPSPSRACPPSPTWDLSGETFTRCFDVGMYFGEVVRRADASFKWDVETKTSTRNIDYGQAVIRGASKIPCNPVRLIVTFAYGIVDGSRKADQLADLSKTWVSILQG